MALLASGRDVRAASVSDRVRDHVSTNLEEPRPKAKKEKPRRKKSERSRPRKDTAVGASSAPPEAEPEVEKPKGPKIPRRVIGRDLELDPRVGGGYRGWVLQQYPAVDVSAQSYFTWSIETKARFFRLVNLHRGYYESNGLSGPRHSGAVVAAQVGERVPQAAWLLGMVGVPITRAWEPVIRYEARAFRTTARPNRPVRVLPHGTPKSADVDAIPATVGALSMVSGFETFVAGMRYSHARDNSATLGQGEQHFPPLYFGVGLTSYGKPYQVTVGDSVLDDVLFDARFRGAGLAFGFELPPKPDRFFLDVAGQVGLGEVRLLEDLTLNELLPQTRPRSGVTPPEWLIGYAQGDVSVGYVHTLLATQPSVLLSGTLTGGGATFFYFKTQAEEGEAIDAPPLNWDFLWGARVALTIPL